MLDVLKLNWVKFLN
ncbi:hypothetical protein LINPERHAP2_LOCUS45958 [Linum perenne]